MLNNIQIRGFKSIDNLELEIKNLTLLVGMNSSGKSSVIQSILLGIQNISFNNSSPLNGSLVSLGNFKEVRNYLINSKEINILMSSQDSENKIEISIFEKNGIEKCKKKVNDKKLMKFLKYQNKNVRFLSSNRIGSKDIYEVNFNQVTDIGFLGAFAIDYFERNKSLVLPQEMILNKETGVTLESQVNYWLSYIINGEIKTDSIEGTDSVKASYKIGNTRYFRPKNVGAGLSYVISIIITLLSSKPGSLNIIENPEIHLHPRAQSRLMEFFIFLSQAGIQLIIETHSDHIFNGIRKGIYQKKIESNKISTYYCNLGDNGISDFSRISFNEEGKVLNHIDGLFDQFDDDLDILLGFK